MRERRWTERSAGDVEQRDVDAGVDDERRQISTAAYGSPTFRRDEPVSSHPHLALLVDRSWDDVGLWPFSCLRPKSLGHKRLTKSLWDWIRVVTAVTIGFDRMYLIVYWKRMRTFAWTQSSTVGRITWTRISEAKKFRF